MNLYTERRNSPRLEKQAEQQLLGALVLGRHRCGALLSVRETLHHLKPSVSVRPGHLAADKPNLNTN